MGAASARPRRTSSADITEQNAIWVTPSASGKGNDTRIHLLTRITAELRAIHSAMHLRAGAGGQRAQGGGGLRLRQQLERRNATQLARTAGFARPDLSAR